MSAQQTIRQGNAALGIELGSTRIKLCLTDADTHEVLATGGHDWENQLVDGLWSYTLEQIWSGIAAAYADLASATLRAHDTEITKLRGIGVSAMMHGYLPFDANDELLTPFRTWRNTNTTRAADELTALFGENIPLRWSIAHLYQAMLDDEAHVSRVTWMTTLAGYVHWKLTGARVLGIGDAAGMLPVDANTHDFDAARVAQFDALVGERAWASVRDLLPEVLVAGEPAGALTEAGARLLDASGTLTPGAPFAPPEGDAGTGMVATSAVAPRTGNVSVGTSVFAMVVLERGLSEITREIDLVATPAGDPVAMVHCNNGASELAAWVSMFEAAARAVGFTGTRDEVFGALFAEAERGAPDAGGVLSYNHLSGEPIAGLTEGRPLVVRQPDADFSLANFMRSQLYGVFGTLSLGMQVLADEHVAIDRMYAHGGVFRTAGTAQQLLADALNTPVSVTDTASEGGAWGMAVLAAFATAGSGLTLANYLEERVFSATPTTTLAPRQEEAEGYLRYLERYRSGLAAERAAVVALPIDTRI